MFADLESSRVFSLDQQPGPLLVFPTCSLTFFFFGFYCQAPWSISLSAQMPSPCWTEIYPRLVSTVPMSPDNGGGQILSSVEHIKTQGSLPAWSGPTGERRKSCWQNLDPVTGPVSNQVSAPSGL